MSTTTNEPIPQNDKILRPKNCYFIFLEEFRKTVKEEGPINERAIAIKAWNALSQEENEPWKKEAKRLKKKHHEVHPGWRFAPLKREDTGGVRKGTKKRENAVQELKLREAAEMEKAA